MNNTWHFLREFESKDLLKRYFKTNYDYDIGSTKAEEILSAFKQGRSYFESAKSADVSVKPVLLYYGIVSLSRGVILILNKKANESNIAPSHGIKIVNWSNIVDKGNLEDIILKTSNGTFTELIKATSNKSYFRANSNLVNWEMEYGILDEDYKFSLKDLSYSFPDLLKSAESWLGTDITSRQLMSYESSDGKIIVGFKGDKNVQELFPKSIFKNQIIEEDDYFSTITYENIIRPHFSQKWNNDHLSIGHPYIIPPFGKLVFLNDVSKMYAASFVFGTISRYYPKTWNNINSGIKNDRILPFAMNLMSLLEDKFPQIVLDILENSFKK